MKMWAIKNVLSNESWGFTTNKINVIEALKRGQEVIELECHPVKEMSVKYPEVDE